MRGLPNIRDAIRLYDVYSFPPHSSLFLPPPQSARHFGGPGRSLTFIKRPRPPRMRTHLNNRNYAFNSCGSPLAVKAHHRFLSTCTWSLSFDELFHSVAFYVFHTYLIISANNFKCLEILLEIYLK